MSFLKKFFRVETKKEQLKDLVRDWRETAYHARKRNKDDDADIFDLCANELEFINESR